MILLASAILIGYGLLRIATAIETHAYALTLQAETPTGPRLVVDNTKER